MTFPMQWREENGALYTSFTFKDFKTAFAFMPCRAPTLSLATAVAGVAEAQQHHPEWTNVWNRVDFRLTTHDAGHIVTEKDRLLAQAIDGLAQSFL